jgi:diguanylate cyclase (GGDEF)-like protein
MTASDLEESLRLDALERQQITDTPRDEAFDRVVRMACAALEAPMGAISFLERDRLWVKAGQGAPLNETPRDTSFCTYTLLGDEPMVVEDAARDPRFAANPHVVEGGVRFYAGATISSREGFKLGTLSVMDRVPRQIGAREGALLKEMAAMAAQEMGLRRRAGTDPLTGLYTRHFFGEVGGREVIKARRQPVPLTAAVLDADPVSRAADEAVLRALGPVCRRVLRGDDLVGRHRGEQLALLLPATALRQTLPVLERLRRDIAVLPELDGQQIGVSIGAAELAPEDLTLGDLLARADRTLARAKDLGRNRVELAA